MSDQHNPAAPTAATDAVSALVLHPGDSVLIGLSPSDRTREDLHAMGDTLRARFPGVFFTFVADVTGLAVQRETQ